MANYRGIAGGISGLSGGFLKGYQLGQQMQDRRRALEAESAFGSTMQNMYNPPPEPPPGSTPNPAQAPMRSPAPTALASQMPGASSLGSSMPGPESAPMRGGGAPTQLGYDFETYRRPQPPQQLDWRTLVTALSKQPGMTPQTMARSMDRAMPFLNSQSQMEWRELSGRIKELEQGRKTEEGQARINQGQERIDFNREKFGETKRINDARIKKINASLDQAAAQAKLSPDTKATLDVHKMFYQRMSTAFNVAQTNLQRAQFEGKPENIATAQQDVAEAEAAMREAETQLRQFLKTKLPGVKVDLSAAPMEGEAPASVTGAAAPPSGGAQFAKTKSGATAQVGGYESPQYLPQTKPKGTKPATMATPNAPAGELPNKTPRVSAQPSQSVSSAASPQPLPKSKALMVKGRAYSVRGNTYVWDGEKLVLRRGAK